MRAAAVLGLLLVASCSGPRSSSAPGVHEAPLRVLTYNTHHGEGLDGRFDLERIAAVIRDSGADLVALQEIDRGTQRSGGVDQLEELAQRTGLYPYFAEFFPFQNGRYGLAILSRVPAESTEILALPPGRLEPRSALRIELTSFEGEPVHFVCAHLDWLEPDTERLAQARALHTALSELPGSVFLAGDLNDVPRSATLQLLQESLRYGPRAPEERFTFPADEPSEEIDYVLFRSGTAKQESSTVLREELASDHRPVLATFAGISLKTLSD